MILRLWFYERCIRQFKIMADSIELRMSVTSIKRVDPYVKEILASSTHVALYKFNTTSNEWEKTETEGALFVYSRNGEPYHSIMVMNRLNTENLIEPIVKDFDYQMQVPFLLYRNSKSKIFGIWFFNREECIKITYLIESIMEGLKDKSERSAAKKENGIDIFSMLSKAQEDFNRTPTKQTTMPPTFSSTPRVPDVTSQSVMDFFAKASTKSNPKVPGHNSEKHVLQRLMSNPAHSVEHIEKQQRSVTPQDQRQSTSNTNADRRSVPISFPNSNTEKKSGLENSFNTTPPYHNPPVNQSSVSPLLNFIQGGTQEQFEVEYDGVPFSQFLENAQKPQLMTPMMFQASTKDKDKKDNSIGSNSQDEKVEEVDLLTEKQLAQALIHLLKHNTEFTKQIHEAYVNSIMERVNISNSKSVI